MKKTTTKKLVFTGLMVALVFLVTYLPFLRIPSPIKGYFNIGDSIIMITAILLGRNCGFAAGAIGSAMADILGGYFIFAPITFIVKGVEGYVVGLIANDNKDGVKSSSRIITAILIGAVIMIAGYFIGEATILKLFDNTFGLTAAIAELPGNAIQGAASSVIAYVISMILMKSRVKEIIEK